MTFFRMFREAATGLRRNFSMVVSIVLVTFISLIFVGAAVLLQMQINQMKTYWYDKAQVAVYLCTDFDTETACPAGRVTESQIEAVRAELESDTLKPFIKEIFFEDQDQAYQNFVEQFADSPVINNVEPAQLGETFWVSLNNPDDSAVIGELMSNTDGVSEVRDQRSYLDQIFRILNGASLVAVGIAALMLVCAVLLISTTIRLSAFARRKELGIMRLVGASNFYIQTPFVLEGMVAALIGALLAGGTLVASVHYLIQGYLAARMPSISFVGIHDALFVWGALIIIGMLLAAFASALAIRRYLRV